MNEIKSYDEMLDTLKDVRNYLKIARADDCVDELDKVAKYLINKNNNKPTVEEVFKEFEKLGYKNKPNEKHPHMIYLVDEDGEPKWDLIICINKLSKKYWKRWGDNSFERFTVEEHQLLTKLFKAWGWFDE